MPPNSTLYSDTRMNAVLRDATVRVPVSVNVRAHMERSRGNLALPWWRAAGIAVLVVWILYAAGVVVALTFSGPSRALLMFGGTALVGLYAGAIAVVGKQRWYIWAAGAALLFLFISFLRHAYFVSRLMSTYSSGAAALSQYVVESRLAIQEKIDQGAYFYLFMYAYHEWLMPVLQLIIALVAFWLWRQVRSNSTFERDARKSGARPSM